MKVHPDINLESTLNFKVEEKCMEEEEVQIDGASKSEVQVREILENPSLIDEANIHSHKESNEAETQEKDSETTRAVMSETEPPGASTEVEDTGKQTTSDGLTSSLEPEKQCEKTAEANDSWEETVSNEEVWYKFGKLLLRKGKLPLIFLLIFPKVGPVT